MGKVALNKSTKHMGSMFDRIAPVYDFLNHFLSAGIDLWWRKMAVKSLPLRQGALVLDVATGTGDLAFSLLKHQPQLRIIGLDLALNMLKKAVAKYRTRTKKGQTFFAVQGDALRVPVKAQSIDMAMIAYGIRNLPDVDRAIMEFRRILKPAGLVLILEFSIPQKGFARQIYLLYFNHVLPHIGGLISGERKAYQYLTESVHDFIGPTDLKKALERAGFSVIKTRLLLGGISYFILAQRPKA